MQGGAELEEPFDLKVEWLQKSSPMTAAVRTYGRGACMSSVRSTDGSMSVADCSGVRWFAVRRNAPTEGDWGRSNQSAAHGGKRFTPMLAKAKTTPKLKEKVAHQMSPLASKSSATRSILSLMSSETL